ncbi:MAG: hypothetical protein HY781_03545 [Chloroflexi bacterium]|nr:hypothetical protein [Chloroflexota bacterium]
MSRKNNRPVHRTPARAEEFNPDYSQTKRDLTRIGILAGAFITILVVLSFFQEQLLALFIK